MKQGYSKALRFISVLLLTAMLMTSQAFTILAVELLDGSASIAPTETTAAPEETTAEPEEATIVSAEAAAAEIGIALANTSEEEAEEESLNVIVQPVLGAVDERESISINTGALNYSEHIVSIPSINGGSFDLDITYDSSKSILEKYDYVYVNEKIDGEYFIVPIAKTDEMTYNELRHNIGSGWSFSIPSMNTDKHNRSVILPGIGTYGYRTDGYSSFSLDYPRGDMRLYSDKTYSNGQFTSANRLAFANGSAYYFSSLGLLMAMVDRFENTVTLKYQKIGSGWYPAEITDVNGNTTTISYETHEDGNVITVTAADGAATVLNTSLLNYGEDNYVLSDMVYPDGERVEFDYSVKNGKYSYSQYGTTPVLHFALLENVTYESGASLSYAYKTFSARLDRGSQICYRLTERRTWDEPEHIVVKNYTEYSYTGNYSLGQVYSTETAEWKNGKKFSTKYTFNTDHLCTNIEEYVDGKQKTSVSNTYDTYHLPSKVVTTVYDSTSSYLTTTELYSHDMYGNTTTYLSPKGEGVSKNTEYTTTYTYSSDKNYSTSSARTYNLPLTVTYKQDANTTVKTQNTLTADNKNIASSCIYVNDVLISKTEYTYNERGQCVSETVYPDITAEIGITTDFVYEGTDLISSTVTGIKDADGNELSDITVSYTYDMMGRPLTHTDANGNTTITVYDSRGRVILVTAPDGCVTAYEYEAEANTTAVSSSGRETVVYDFDGTGKQQYVYYSSGEVISETFYDDVGRVIAEATSRGSTAANTVYYTYDAFDRVKSKMIYSADGTREYYETYTYDDVYSKEFSYVKNTVKGSTNAPDIVSAVYTNKYGETIKEDVGGVITQYTYDYVGNPVSVETSGVTAYTYDYRGNVLTETNPVGDTRTVTYDGIGRKVSESDFLGNITTYTYDNAGRLLTVTSPLTDTENSVTKYYYDANGNVTKTMQTSQVAGEEVQWRTVEQVYDCMNRVTDIISHVSDSEKQYTHYTYNLAGDLTDVYTGMSVPFAVANADSYSHMEYAYDERGNNISVTDALGQTESYEYDTLGMLVSSTQRDGMVTRYTYNALGSVVTENIYEDASSETPLSEKSTVYSLTGAPLSVTIDGVNTKYTYDGGGRVLTENEDKNVKSYTYDSYGRMVGFTHKYNGNTRSSAEYTYDSLDRLVSVTSGGETTTYTYDANGNRLGQTTGEVTAEYTYNKANLVTSMTNKMVNADGDEVVISSFAYTYYTDGNMYTKSETLLETTTATTYVYDGVGRLTSETTDDKVISYYYDANSNRTLMNNGGVITSYTYDKNNRLLTEGETVYTYDANGNMLTAGRKSYTYNARGQQIGYAEHAEEVHIFVNGICTYCGEPEIYMLGDADGNGEINFLDFIISMRYYVEAPETLPAKDLDGDGVVGRKDYLIFARELGGVDENYLPNLFVIDDLLAFADVDGNGEVGAADYLLAYATLYEKGIDECLTNGISLNTSMQAADINGDGTVTEADKDIGIDYALSGSSTYPIGETVDNTSSCDEAAKYNTVTAQYGYSPIGLRASKTVDGETTNFVYSGMQIVYEYSTSSSDRYYYGLNRTHNSNGEIYVYNAHGDTVQLVKDNEVVVTYTYDAFGNLTSQTGESDNPFLYCSEYFDEEIETYYLRARYYDPVIGRFTQEDPMGDGLNWYIYCYCNPVMYVDPSGYIVTEWDKRNCSPEDVIIIAQATIEWNIANSNGDQGGMSAAHAKANAVREKYLSSYETVGENGHIIIELPQTDIDRGVKIITIDGDQYIDVTSPIYTALKQYEDEFSVIEGTLFVLPYFYSIVNHGAVWDIKRPAKWKETIGTTYPNFNKNVIFNGEFFTPEDLGNITYGYIGARLGIGLPILGVGSYVAAGLPLWGNDFTNEIIDQIKVAYGYELYWNK